MTLINNQDDKKEPKNKVEKGDSEPVVAYWKKLRTIAALLHDVSCKWGDERDMCGSTGCDWVVEEEEEHPWAMSVHCHFIELAELIVKIKDINQYYLDNLIALHCTHNNLAKTIISSVHNLCDMARITYEL